VVAVLVYDPDEDENTPVPADPPVDPSRPTYEGRYQSHGGFNANQNNESGFSKLSVRGTGSDGSSFAAHNLFHGSLSATGVENAFERLNCR
jgi:hypothetical protein